MKDKILIICPTRNRPDRANEMLCSVKSTSDADVVFLIDDDQIDLYKDFKADKLITASNETTTEKINEAFFKKQCYYKYFSVSNDDFVYHTQQWDKKIIHTLEDYGGGIAYGNDMLQKERMPTTSIISGAIVRELGWLQMPKLTHLYGDEVWRHIGKSLNILFYMPEIIIEHRHWIVNKMLMDDTYKKTNSTAMYEADRLAFEEWKRYDSGKDIDTVRRSLGL